MIKLCSKIFLFFLIIVSKTENWLKDSIIYTILKKLDCDARLNVYIGITGFFIAIVIFIAEAISNKKVEINKELILDRTKIKNNSAFVMIVMIIIWLSALIDERYPILYCIIQFLINVLVIFSTVKTFNMFSKVIKFTTNKKYFDDELKKYVYEKIEENVKYQGIQEKYIETKRDEFFKFIKDSNIFAYENYVFNFHKEYKILDSNFDGYIIDFNYNKLRKIEEMIMTPIQTIITNNGEINTSKVTEPKIYITKTIGDKCSKNFAFVYYKDVNKKMINLMNTTVKVDNKKIKNIDEQLSKIMSDMFYLAFENSLNPDYGTLLDIYDFLCSNNFKNVIPIFLRRVYFLSKEYADKLQENKNFCSFLNDLLRISYKYERYEDSKKMTNYLYFLYINRIRLEDDDYKKVAYDYAIFYALPNLYSIDNKEYPKYYDLIMSNILLFIAYLLKKKKIEAILVLFENIPFSENDYYIKEEFNEKEIVDFQFIIVIIYFILYMYDINEKFDNENNSNTNEEFIKEVSKLLEVIKNTFFDFYDMYDIIVKFNKYSKIKSEINVVMEDIDTDNEEHKYKRTWTYVPIGVEEVLKCLIYMFDIYFVDYNLINYNELRREELYELKKEKDIFDSSNYDKLENYYNYNLNYKSTVDDLFNKILENVGEKQREYERIALLDIEKINKFKENIINYAKEKSELEIFMQSIGKEINTDRKVDIAFGIYEILPRNWFVVDKIKTVGISNIEEDFGKTFRRGMQDKVVDYLKSISNVSSSNLNYIIEKLDCGEKYILLTSRRVLNKMKLKNDDGYLKIQNRKIKVILVNNMKEIIIASKESLPYINICKFSEKYEKEYIIEDESLYFYLKEISKDDSEKKKIIKGGTLKESDILDKISLKLYKPIEVVEGKEKESYLIKLDD